MRAEILDKFGKRVRDERLQRGLSQEELAEKAELHRTYIGMIERGEKNITLINIQKIAKALVITVDELLKGITEETRYLRSVNVGGYFAKHISQKELDKIEDSLEFDEATSQVGELMQLDWLESERWKFSFPDRPAPPPGIIMNY